MTKTFHIKLTKSATILQQHYIGHKSSVNNPERCLMDSKGESLTEKVLQTLILKSKIKLIKSTVPAKQRYQLEMKEVKLFFGNVTSQQVVKKIENVNSHIGPDMLSFRIIDVQGLQKFFFIKVCYFCVFRSQVSQSRPFLMLSWVSMCQSMTHLSLTR